MKKIILASVFLGLSIFGYGQDVDNSTFVSAEETSVALRATIKKVISKEELGRFNLKNSQTALDVAHRNHYGKQQKSLSTNQNPHEGRWN